MMKIPVKFQYLLLIYNQYQNALMNGFKFSFTNDYKSYNQIDILTPKFTSIELDSNDLNYLKKKVEENCTSENGKNREKKIRTEGYSNVDMNNACSSNGLQAFKRFKSCLKRKDDDKNWQSGNKMKHMVIHSSKDCINFGQKLEKKRTLSERLEQFKEIIAKREIKNIYQKLRQSKQIRVKEHHTFVNRKTKGSYKQKRSKSHLSNSLDKNSLNCSKTGRTFYSINPIQTKYFTKQQQLQFINSILPQTERTKSLINSYPFLIDPATPKQTKSNTVKMYSKKNGKIEKLIKPKNILLNQRLNTLCQAIQRMKHKPNQEI